MWICAMHRFLKSIYEFLGVKVPLYRKNTGGPLAFFFLFFFFFFFFFFFCLSENFSQSITLSGSLIPKSLD